MNAWSDSKPYSGTVQIRDEGIVISITHIHTRGQDRRQWYESQVRSFSECHYTHWTQGILQAFRKTERIFCTAVPALTLIWLSPDERYIVGLSGIKYANPYQVVVYSITGDLLFRRSIRCVDTNIEGCSETITNHIFWFHEKDPGISLLEKGDDTLELSLNSRVNSRISFVFPMKPVTPLDATPCGKDWVKMSAEGYWLNYVQDTITIESEKDEFICLSVHESRGVDYYYINRKALSDRKAKEEIFLMFLDAALGYRTSADMTQEAFEQVKFWLSRIAGVNCTTKDQCIDWLIQHQSGMRLSDDGKYLVEK